MSTTENKDIVRRQWYQELWDNWNVSKADELFTSDYRLHLSGVPAPMSREATKEVVKMFGASFPDLQHTIEEIIAEGNTVAARWTVRGTHRGDFQGIPATGKSVRLSGTTVHHMADGKIVETWLTLDNHELLQQLGVVHQPTQV
jgi:steroid delta-isomerase-like uncharacterized protein